ncbi:serine protease [uncultured Thiohalocapsa sp.]|uniref:S1 family peptidase n=1 Tax=uncultured Thiohalocapsa sp. TaxID=768990 RepID=UPI0025DAEB09|nr:serine protease [uncultured Thiohalocapsa sp.]
MLPEPQIVSLWRGWEVQPADYRCAGLRLDPRHILTVRHAFDNWPDQAPIIVRLIRNDQQGKRATVLQRHAELDAAILALDVPDGSVPLPALQRTGQATNGKPVVLHVVDPDEFGAHPLRNYSIGRYDERTSEYILSPDNAVGHSGGIVEVEGGIVGLLARRAKDDPLCRAVAMHRLWPWIEGVLTEQAAGAPRAQERSPEPAVVSAAYHQLVERVRKNVRDLLQRPEAEPLRRNWSDDPIARFDPTQPTDQVIAQIDALHVATEQTIPLWQARPIEPVADARTDRKGLCQTLITELVKLAVDPGLDYDVDALAGSPPARLKIASRYAVSGEIAYFALGDLLQQLRLQPDSDDIASAQSLCFVTDIAGGQGEDQYQELLRKLWMRVMGEPDPGRLSDKQEDLLMGLIWNQSRRDRRRYLIVMPAEEQAFPALLDRKWTGRVKPGILEHEPGQCRYLLAQEKELFALLYDYLRLLEKL